MHSGEPLGVFFFFDGALISRRLFFEFRGLHVVFGRFEIELDVGLDTADLVVGLALNDVDRVVPPTVLDVNCVALVKHRVVSEFLLKDGLRVAKVDKCGFMGPDLHISALLQVHVAQDDLAALLNTQVVHHPNRDVAHAFLR